MNCPHCGMPEEEAMHPRTFYACGTTDYDGRPGTERRSTSCREIARLNERVRVLEEKNEFAYKDIAEVEELLGYSVNDAYRIGWNAARLTVSDLHALAGGKEGGV